MRLYRLRPAAEADLEAIWSFTAETWSRSQAEHYVGAVFDALESLAAHPQRGQPIPWIGGHYRRFRSGRHIIFYIITADADVDVVRILHEKSDVPRHLGTP